MATNRYTGVAIALHWLMAIGIIGLFSLGVYMHKLPLSPEKLKLYSWHKWAGVTVFMLVIARLAWRVTHRPPALPEQMSRLEQWVAHAGHHLLYLLMFAIPLSGWLMSSAKGFQTVWFGLLPLPNLLEKNKEIGDLLQTVHWAFNMVLVAIVLGHAAAAMKHHFLSRDDVLTRMLPKFTL
jgi:cytochrome b561